MLGRLRARAAKLTRWIRTRARRGLRSPNAARRRFRVRRRIAGLVQARAERRRPKKRLGRVIVWGRRRGPTGWRGTRSIFVQWVTPRMKAAGLRRGSRKRAWGFGSDHNIFSLDAYAIDFPTFDGEAIARELGESLGIEGWEANSYESYVVEIDGRRFRIQILWGAAIDHDDHIHVGIKAL